MEILSLLVSMIKMEMCWYESYFLMFQFLETTRENERSFRIIRNDNTIELNEFSIILFITRRDFTTKSRLMAPRPEIRGADKVSCKVGKTDPKSSH